MWSVPAGTLQHLLLHRHHLPTLGRSSVWARRCPVSQPWNPRRPTEQWANEHIISCFFPQGPHYVAILRKATQVPTISPVPSLRWLPSSFSFFLSTGWVFIQTSESTYYKTENVKQRAEAGEDSKMIQTMQVLELGRVEQTLKLQLTINNPVWWCQSCDFP